MSILAAALALAVQGAADSPTFPESAAFDQRFDCEVSAPRRAGGAAAPYPGGDYTFLFPAGAGLITGHMVPFVYTLADGRSFFEQAAIEAPDPDFGPAFGFALRTRSGALIAFTRRDASPPGRARLRGSYLLPGEAGEIALSGECRVRQGPVPVSISG